MDFILPNDDTMEIMREEFAKLKKDSYARAFALSEQDDSPADPPTERESDNGAGGAYIGTAVSTVLLLLYFVKHLGYNISYGTQIFNTHRGLEQIRPDGSSFGRLNNLH